MKVKFKWLLLVVVLVSLAYQIEDSLTAPAHPETYEIKDFPIYQQPDHVTCGPTSVRMVLKRYGYDVDMKEIRKVAKTDFYVKGEVQIGGTAPEYEQVALRDLGVPCQLKSSNIEELKHEVSQNKPVIVCVRSGKRLWHWIVVIGYTKDKIITADPCGERIELPTTQFDNAWSFVSDLDGEDLSEKCKLCGGTGYWSKHLGPLGKCDLCGGSGKMPDWYWLLMDWGELRGHIAIVPRSSVEN
jgi:hypothetical protein